MKSLIRKLSDPSNPNSWALKFRQRRFELYQELVDSLPKPYSILDIGGTEGFWETMGFLPSRDFDLTIVNLQESPPSKHSNVTVVTGDACELNQFSDSQFDIVFSNSVIEHVGNEDKRLSMAREIKRVGRRYFIQTPNRHFPIDPHFPFPLFQFYPLSVQATLLQLLPLAWVGRISQRDRAIEAAKSVDLLSLKEFSQLFPGSKLYKEKLFGLNKSFVLYDGW
ncbi:MAG: class I SAM-dependent methyltransferase [Pseudomonadales bacterium]